MLGERSSDYLNLNREGSWRGFDWEGLERRNDGALQLASVPLWEGGPLRDLENLPAPHAPAGIAIDPEGTVYYSDPAGDRVWRIDGCTGKRQRVPCVGGSGEAPGLFHEPRGLLIPRGRRALFVADSGSHRIQVFDPETGQLLAIWGQPGATPAPDAAPGRFSSPWTLAGDAAGNVYVLDYGNRRVQKFSAAGDVQPEFWEHMQAAGLLHEPGDLGVSEEGDRFRLWVVDREVRRVFAFDARGDAVAVDLGVNARPMGIAIGGEALFLGNNETRRVDEYRIGDALEEVGEAERFSGPVAALALDSRGGLLVHTGLASPPLRLTVGRGHRRRGALWTREPIRIGDVPVIWHRLRAEVGSLPAGAHLQLFVRASSDSQPPPVGWNEDRHSFFADAGWRENGRSGAPSLTDLYIGGDPAPSLWIGAELAGDGLVTPAVSQIRVEFDHEGYLPYLPAIYRNAATCGDFLPRLLSLFESLFSEVEWKIDGLPRLFDPAAAPEDFLRWLAGWLGLELDEGWDAARRRAAIAEAFALFARRGTRAGLERSLRLFGGVPAIVEEPMATAAWWVLPDEQEACCDACAAGEKSTAGSSDSGENSVLGSTTMLASAQPDGAVLGDTAILDQSHLITGEEFGAPLFTELAHRFSVLVPRGSVTCAGAVPRLRSLIDREKPAHTQYHLCLIEPEMRVGFQARLGVDTLVAGPPASLRLGVRSTLGADAALGGNAALRVGERTRLGMTTRVG